MLPLICVSVCVTADVCVCVCVTADVCVRRGVESVFLSVNPA